MVFTESGIERRQDFCAHRVNFRMIAKQKRRFKDTRGRENFADAMARQRRPLQLAEADLAQHVGFVTRDAAGVELDREPPLALRCQFLGPGIEGFHPGRTGGCERGEFEDIGIGRVRGRLHTRHNTQARL